MFATVSVVILSFVVVAAVTDGDRPAMDELRSAIVVSQLALSQQTLVLQEVLNATRSLLKPASEELHCPPPYTRVIDECFYLSSQKLKWQEARQHCQGMAGDLATPARVFALFSFLLDSGVSESHRVWVGGTDAHQPGTWQWLDGSAIPASVWSEYQPNNYNDDQHCLDLLMDKHPPLNDDQCSSKYRFVCQF